MRVIQNDDNNIEVNQTEYIESIKSIEKIRKDDQKEPLDKKENQQLRKAVGQLSWAQMSTRPDLAFDTLEMSTNMQKGKLKDLKKAQKTIKKAKEKEIHVKFRRLGHWKNLHLEVYSDASWATIENREKSVGGEMVFLVNEHSEATPLYWRSKTIRRVANNVKAAETMACFQAVDTGIAISRQLHEIYTGQPHNGHIPVDVFIDSEALEQSIYSSKQIEEKKLRTEIAGFKQNIADGDIRKVEWVSTNEMYADLLTKNGVKPDLVIGTLSDGIIKRTNKQSNRIDKNPQTHRQSLQQVFTKLLNKQAKPMVSKLERV